MSEFAKRYISLGAGVQSTTMALMAAKGLITPMPDGAIFADTQWEPKKVYEHLNWLEGQLPFPVHRVTKGSILQSIKEKSDPNNKLRVASIPWHTVNPDGSKGMGRRQCTHEFKIEPIIQAQRRLLGVPKGARVKVKVEMWIGISLDEATRMKPSRKKWQVNRWPLIEMRMTRFNCLEWMKLNGYPEPPKSACIGCPFHNDDLWKRMKQEAPEEFAEAVEIDKIIRNAGTQKSRGFLAEQFMHNSRKPLSEVDFDADPNRGQLNLFENECEGMCGV